MEINNKEYMPRLIDKKITDYLSVFGAILIEGPKWCGKTWTSLNHAKSVKYMDEPENKKLALLDPKAILTDDENEKPELIDEWHLVPELWDIVRRECDKSPIKGNYILTGSTLLSNKTMKEKIYHSGVGRIGRIKMYTMSLYESGDSTGKASIIDMLNDTQKNCLNNQDVNLTNLANLIVRGGWPANLETPLDKSNILPNSYIDSIINIEIDSEHKIDKNKIVLLLKSLARNESSLASNNKILEDIMEYGEGVNTISSRDTLYNYLDNLNRLNLIANEPAYSLNYRSPERLGKAVKRHLVDPSLACACLNLTSEKLIKDLKTFGLMFEAMVERDLRIYADYLNGKLYHFRDNVSGLEVDAIIEFPDGEYGAIEIKLGKDEEEKAKDNLLKFYNNMKKKPKFMCIIEGICNTIVKDKETGIYILPITALKP